MEVVMDSDRASTPPRIPQNVFADVTVRRLLELPVPRKFNIVRLRPADLPRAERFETVADVGTRRINEAARLEEIDGLGRIAARLRACRPQARCTSVCCPSCSRKFRRWFICQALRHERDLELQVLTVALALVPSNKLSQINLGVLKAPYVATHQKSGSVGALRSWGHRSRPPPNRRRLPGPRPFTGLKIAARRGEGPPVSFR